MTKDAGDHIPRRTPWHPAAGWANQLLIDGALVQGDGPSLAIENPATEAVIATIREASVAQLEQAIGAARRAFDAGPWGSPEERRRALERLADLLEQHGEDIGGALVEEVGTPVNLVNTLQLGTPIALLRYYAVQASVDRTRMLGADEAGASESMIRHIPVGVIGAIAAYNYPLLLMILKLAPALAAGCTSVVLPSPQTPLATLMVARLIGEVGFPPGVVNILVGGIEVARTLTAHPDVDKVAFTGSVGVGRSVMQQAAETLTGVVLELGGKSAAIILPDADLPSVASACLLRFVRNAGQGCASPTRILVHEAALPRFLELSRPVIEGVRIGDPWDPRTVAGPLISRAHRARVEAYVERALASGARIVAGGGRPDLDQGWYMNAALLADLDNGFEIARAELFGPVGIVLPYRDLEHAVTIANDSELGLAAMVFGRRDEALQVAKRLRVGSVYVNGGGQIRLDAPMGGLKQSGIGREYGEEGILEYLEPQHIQWATG